RPALGGHYARLRRPRRRFSRGFARSARRRPRWQEHDRSRAAGRRGSRAHGACRRTKRIATPRTMRVVVVGPALERARLRQALPPTIEVVGEVATLAAARELDADAFLVASDARDHMSELPPEVLTPREIEVLELVAE